MWCTLLSLVHVLILPGAGQTTPEFLSSNPRISLAVEYVRNGHPELAGPQYDAAIRESAKGDPLVHGHILNLAGAFYHEVGNFPRAEACLRKSAAIWRARYGPEHISLIPMINRMACIHIESGQPSKAERLHLEVWLARIEEQKPGSEDHINLLGTQATLLAQRHRYKEAEEYSAKALGFLAARGEGESMDAVAMVNNLGLVSIEGGNLQRARQYLERADDMLRRSPTGHAFYSAVNRTLMARILHREKRYAEAEVLLKDAIAMMEARCGPDSLRTALLLVEYGNVLKDQKKKAEARQAEQRARAIVEASGLSAYNASVDAADLTRRGR